MGRFSAEDLPIVYLADKRLDIDLLDFTNWIPAELLADEVFRYFKLQSADAFFDLTQDLIAYSCRNQANDPPLDQLTERRRDARRLATRLRDTAAEVGRLLHQMEWDAGELDGALGWSPALIEEVFDVDTGTSIFLPPQIACLETLFSKRDRLAVRYQRALEPLASLPIRTGSPGRAGNVTLNHAVRSCRDYWVASEGRPWGMYRLAEAAVRKQNERANLTGEAEQFLANMLAIHNVTCTIQELSNAWKATDKA